MVCAACPSNANCLGSQAIANDNFYLSAALGTDAGYGVAMACPRGLCVSALSSEAPLACKDRTGDVRATLVSCCAVGRRLPAESNPLCGACDEGLAEVRNHRRQFLPAALDSRSLKWDTVAWPAVDSTRVWR